MKDIPLQNGIFRLAITYTGWEAFPRAIALFFLLRFLELYTAVEIWVHRDTPAGRGIVHCFSGLGRDDAEVTHVD